MVLENFSEISTKRSQAHVWPSALHQMNVLHILKQHQQVAHLHTKY